jgi:tetrapyrrole methylase family protein/MazG family protein
MEVVVAKYSFEEFMDIIRKLRSKEGCPWDREQTHETLKTCLLRNAMKP